MFSSTFTTFLLAALAATLVHSAPTPPLDAATLLKNGQDAQKLNTLFQTIKEADPCTNEDKACMSGGVAMCVQGKWKTTNGQCSASQKCFALPSVREAGTLVTCTSEKSALSAIEASGASGGIFGAPGGNSTSAADDDNNSNDNTTSTSISATATSSTAAESTQTASPDANDSNDDGEECDMECEDEGDEDPATTGPVTTTPSSAPEESPESTSTSTPASDEPAESTSTPSEDGAGPVTVTVTLTAQPTTFAPQTRTLSPDDASSILSSLMANGATIIVSPTSPGSVDVKEPSITTAPIAQPSRAAANQPAPTTVPLTAAPSASAASSGGYNEDY